MGGLDDATEDHVSCLCPEGFLAMTSPLPAYLRNINASVDANLMESGLPRNLGIRPCKSSANQAVGSLLLIYKDGTIHNLTLNTVKMF